MKEIYCDKWGNLKTMNPFKKVSGRNRRFPNYQTWKRLGMDKKWDGFIPDFSEKLQSEQKVQECDASKAQERT